MSAPFNEFGPFAVGEVVEGVGYTVHTYRNGQQCEIIEPLRERLCHYATGGGDFEAPAYVVRWSDGERGGALPHQLRRKRPPATDSHERTFMADIRDLADKAPQRVKESV